MDEKREKKKRLKKLINSFFIVFFFLLFHSGSAFDFIASFFPARFFASRELFI